MSASKHSNLTNKSKWRLLQQDPSSGVPMQESTRAMCSSRLQRFHHVQHAAANFAVLLTSAIGTSHTIPIVRRSF